MHPKPSKLSGIVALCLISVLTVFLFACKNDLSDLQGSDTRFDEYQPNMTLEEEIAQRVHAMHNAPKDFIEAYISLQRNDPTHIYVTMNSFTESEDTPFNPENPKNNYLKLGLSDVALVYSRKFTADEIKHHNLNNKLHGIDNYSVYGTIYKINRQEFEALKYKVHHNDDEIHDDYDRPASYPGGNEALKKTLKENLHYPESAITQGIEDRVMLSFVINKAGHFVYLNIEKEPLVQDEALRIEFMKAAFEAVKATEGQWNPAEKDGRYVYSRMTLPIEFKLDKK
jgi:hypothetical protein